MKCLINILLVGAVGAMLPGCGTKDFLNQTTIPDRAAYGDAPIDPSAAPPVEIHRVTSAPAPVVEQVAGTWTFTTPPTVTRIQKRTGDYDQFTLYNGRPAGEDLPFAVITVSQDRVSVAETNPETYKVSNKREYILNGNIAQEWTGLTEAGAGFCELIIRRTGTAGQTGDVCHAIALARTEEEQKVALPILESITWKPTR